MEDDIRNTHYESSNYTLQTLVRSYLWYRGSEFHMRRATSSGWYLTTREPIFNDYGRFDIYRIYGPSGVSSIYKFLKNQWDYFEFHQSINVGDIVMKGGNYHEITNIFLLKNQLHKSVVFTVKSLVTGTETYVGYQKVPKLHTYNLTDRQKQNISKKRVEMEDRVQSALKNTKVELIPRKRLGMQSKYVKEWK